MKYIIKNEERKLVSFELGDESHISFIDEELMMSVLMVLRSYNKKFHPEVYEKEMNDINKIIK